MRTAIITAILLLVMVYAASGCTRTELDTFLMQDTTDQCVWVLNTHMCGHFTEELIANASCAGIRMWPTYLYIRGGEWNGHIICAVYIDDRIWFVEPQSDLIISYEQLPLICRGYIIGSYLRHAYTAGSYVRGSPDGILGEIGRSWGY